MSSSYSLPAGSSPVFQMPEGGFKYDFGSFGNSGGYQLPEASIPKTSGMSFFGGQGKDYSGLLSAGGNFLGGAAGLIRSFRGGSDQGGMDLGNPFDPKYVDEARAKVDTEYGKLLEQLGGIVNDIAYLTGNTVPDAVQEFRNRYKDYTKKAYDTGHKQLFGFDPNAIGPTSLEDYGDKATRKMYDTMGKFSAINRKNFMNVATDPDTVEIDPNVFQPQFNKYFDKANKQLMDYSGGQTQEFISGAGRSGSRYGRERMAGFFADSPEVARLMDFGA